MGVKEKLGIKENVIAIITHKDGTKETIKSGNIIGDEGDKYYAQKACGESPTNAFNTLELGDDTIDATGWTSGHPAKTSNRSHMSSKIANSQKAVAGGYPKTNDTDPDNTGAGVDVISWKFTYAKADFANNNIIATLITVTSPGVSAPILTGFSWPSKFQKTADDTLTVFVNHTCNGV